MLVNVLAEEVEKIGVRNHNILDLLRANTVPFRGAIARFGDKYRLQFTPMTDGIYGDEDRLLAWRHDVLQVNHVLLICCICLFPGPYFTLSCHLSLSLPLRLS